MAVKVIEGVDYKILDDDYRAIYLTNYRPKQVRKGVRYYRCIYCGMLVPEHHMQVDHIIPKTRFKAGISWNPNRAWNLGASCQPCNGTKSNYVDERVLIGFRNKYLFGRSVGRGSVSGDSGVSVLIGIVIALLYLLSITLYPVAELIVCGITQSTLSIMYTLAKAIIFIRYEIESLFDAKQLSKPD